MLLNHFYSILLLIIVVLSSTVQANGIITTLAGNGTSGYSGDNNTATNAQLKEPHDITIDSAGNLYIVDTLNSVIRKIDTTQVITTIAGNGTKGYTGDGGLATIAQLDWPRGIAVDASGNVYVADTLNSVIRKVNMTDGNISTVAGVDFAGYNSDNVLATLSALYEPVGLSFDNGGNLYIADSKNGRIRKIDTSQIITTVASGLTLPTGLAVDSGGNIYFADNGSNLIQRIDKATGTVTTVIEGTVLGGIIYDVAVDPQNHLYVSLRDHHLIVKLDSGGNVIPIAGTGTAGYNGDNILASTALLSSPRGITIDNQGNLYVTDSGNHRLRKVELNVSLTVKKIGSGEGTITAPSGVMAGIHCDSSCTEATESYARNTVVDPIVATASEGSLFIGWSEACSGQESSVTVTLETAKTCVAQFEKLYTLQAEKTGNGSGVISSHEDPPLINCGQECVAQYTSDSKVTLKATPEESNYFDGWSGDCSGTENAVEVTLDADKTCTATFKTLPQLTVEAQGHGTIIDKSSKIDCGSSCNAQYDVNTEVELTATASEDSTFLRWTGDCSGTQPTTTVTLETTDKKCVAVFRLLPVLTVKVVGSGSVLIGEDLHCSDECSQFYRNSPSVTLVAEFVSGSAFKGWSGHCSGTISTTSVSVDKDKTCTATFEVLPVLTVKTTGKGMVTSDPSGIQCGSDCSEPYPTGTSVQLVADPAEDSFLLGWSGNCSGKNSPVTVAVNNNVSCTAAFELSSPPLTVTKTGNGTITSTPAGIHCGGDCITQTAPFPYNNRVKLTATADTDWKFVEWGEGCSGQITPTDILVDTTKSCTAQFKLAIPSLQVEITGGGTVTSNPAGIHCRTGGTECFQRFVAGAQVTLTALADDGLQLKAWGGDCAGADTSTQVTIGEEAKTCTALFEPPPPLPPDSTSLQFSLANYIINETDGIAVVLVTRAANKQGQVSVDYQTVDGSALAGSDYETMTGTLTWADGDNRHKEIRIPILKDNVTEAAETATIRLTNVKGIARLGELSSATITIIDIPVGGGIQFSANQYTVHESDSSATITVDRVGGNEGIVTIEYATSDDQAMAGSDYLPAQGRLTWEHQDSQSKQFKVNVLPDDLKEGEETLVLALANPTGGATLGAISTATLKILDSFGNPTTDYSTIPGTLQFTASNYQVAENEGAITITVSRILGSKGVIEVNYATGDGTAKTGQDYIGVAGTFRWLEGDNRDQSFTVGILDDGLREETETVILKLSEPTGGAVLGDNAEAVINIADDDAVTIQFSSTHYLVDEDAKKAVVTVTRLGSPIGSISVSYETIATTAISGEDYQTTTGILVWNHGDIEDKTFTIPIIDDRDVEGNESLQVRLFDLSSHAALGMPTEATVTIVENDSSDCKPTTNVIDCTFVNTGMLENIRITEHGTVIGGNLGGIIESEGLVQNVTFLPKTQLIGGLARGDLKSEDPIRPATLTQVHIVAGSSLTSLIVGRGSVIDSDVLLGEGVCFEDNISIPSVVDLAGTLGTLSAPELNTRAIQLHRDVLCYGAVGGITGAINGLQDLTRQNWVLNQNSLNGYLELAVDDFYFAVLPYQVQQILRKQVDEYIHQGMTVSPDKRVTFITHTGREVKTYPAVQNPKALLAALRQLNLFEISQERDGQLKVPFENKKYYSAYPSIFSTLVTDEMSAGFAEKSVPYFKGINVVLLRFFDASSQLRQQYFYPSAADKSAFQGLSSESESVFHADGQAEIYVGAGATKRVYRGLFGYEVKQENRTGRLQAEIIETGDFNGDGWGDYQVIYPNGERQIMYRDTRANW